jgi:4-amino-4-deoxy-L-arabinose transferase-like glycosyltransferase
VKPHRLRGALLSVSGAVALGALMWFPRFASFGIALGTTLLAVVLVGLLDFAGAMGFEPAPPAHRPAPADLTGAPRWLKLLAGFDVRILYLGLALVVAGICRISVIGTMAAKAPWTGPLLVGLGLAAVAVARWKRRPFDGELHQGFLVLAVSTAMIMATLGSQGLWDCWETHYGEVARRQLEQDDWISLWWEAEWFYSKPILIFWMMNLGMALFGVRVGPDEIPSYVEWGLRFLVGALAIAVVCGVYELLARRVSRRSGLFAAIVLTTMPLYGLMTRQAITDLPFVGFMTLAVVFFLLGVTADPEARVEPWHVPLGRGRTLPLSAFHAVVAGYVAVGFPQFMYYATRSSVFRSGTLGHGDLRNVTSRGHFFHLSLSDLDAKLGGAISSITGLRLGGPIDLSLDWFVLGMLFLVPFLLVLFTLRGERRVSRLCFHGMYITLSLSIMAKGLAGLALPLLGLFGYWLVVVPWGSLRRPVTFVRWHLDRARRLDMLRGSILFLLMSMSWYVAMTVRHGMAFINRFLIHDHLKRLTAGVHGDTGTFGYFAQQFGYAAFPWVALVPFALLAWPRLGPTPEDIRPEDRARAQIRLFTATWGLLSFALLCMMVTKFHHYIFPVVPAAAILIGLLVDDVWEGRLKRVWPLVLAGLAMIATVAIDFAADPEGKGAGLRGDARLVMLFIYKYSRPYPEGPAYDFRAPLLAFSAIFAAALVLWLVARWRKAAIVLSMLTALAFGHFVTQHYMVQLAPHWTQKHIIDEYYARRRSPEERLVAFQMNWKGENFYTGNRAVIYVSTKDSKFEDWIAKHRGERQFFITEHSRFANMSRRAGASSGPLKPFADTCNKYMAGWADRL